MWVGEINMDFNKYKIDETKYPHQTPEEKQQLADCGFTKVYYKFCDIMYLTRNENAHPSNSTNKS